MDRALNIAVVSSLALHAALLFGVSMQRDPAKRDAAPAPIAARLVEPPPVAAPSPPPSSPPQVEPLKPKPQPAPPRRLVKRKPAAAPQPVPESVREPPSPPPPAPPSAPMAQPAPPAPPSVAKLQEQDEARLRDAYRLAVIDAARGHNRYPPLARENNWEGEVRVRMWIGLDGRITALSVQKSSGHEVLDRQALEMFKRAQARVPVPAPLRGKPFSLELRAIYNLKDQVSG